VLIVFGNPNAGTPLMQSAQEVGLDLPQKFLVWENRPGEVLITYHDPFFLGKRHNVQGQEERLGATASTLASFASAGAGLEKSTRSGCPDRRQRPAATAAPGIHTGTETAWIGVSPCPAPALDLSEPGVPKDLRNRSELEIHHVLGEHVRLEASRDLKRRATTLKEGIGKRVLPLIECGHAIAPCARRRSALNASPVSTAKGGMSVSHSISMGTEPMTS
jgi:hypothetical protein